MKWVVEEMENWEGVIEAPTPLSAAQKYGDIRGDVHVTPSPGLNELRTDNVLWFDVWDAGGNLVDNYRVSPHQEDGEHDREG